MNMYHLPLTTPVCRMNYLKSPVVIFDQSIYAIALGKCNGTGQISLEEQVAVMLRGHHIEMAAFKALGDCLDDSGCTGALVQTGIGKSGTAILSLKPAT